jgi:hypothetical protein
MHGKVAEKFRGTTPDGQIKTPKLMDWKGVIAKQYGASKKLTNVYLIDAEGSLQFSAAGKGTPQDTEPLLEAIDLAVRS